jgi:hypothetical protein
MNGKVLKQIKGFEKGDFIRVDWYDASECIGQISDHKKPEYLVNEWGIFLGLEGNPKHILLGKNHIERDQRWQAARIPVSLIQGVSIVAKKVVKSIWLRRYTVAEYKRDSLVVRK